MPCASDSCAIPLVLIYINTLPALKCILQRDYFVKVYTTLVLRFGYLFSRPASLWGWLMCNALNGIAIVPLLSRDKHRDRLSSGGLAGHHHAGYYYIDWYSANYFAALEARRDRRRFCCWHQVVMTILLNFIHLSGAEYRY